jgi:hypothetical protein
MNYRYSSTFSAHVSTGWSCAEKESPRSTPNGNPDRIDTADVNKLYGKSLRSSGNAGGEWRLDEQQVKLALDGSEADPGNRFQCAARVRTRE